MSCFYPFRFWAHRQKWVERNYRDGKYDGLVNFWYKNGQKQMEANTRMVCIMVS